MQKKYLGFIFSFFISLLNLFPVLSANAGDRALVDVIGYSKDGRYFAFEEFGIQDGSGFAYSSIYIIDLNDDSWVIGTPIRVLEEMDERTYEVEAYAKENVAKVRALAHEQAKPRLEGLEIVWPAQTLTLIGDGMPETEGLSLRFGVPSYVGGMIGDYTLEMQIFETQSSLTCAEWTEQDIIGFLLKLGDYDFNNAVEIYRDNILPRSRNCALGYKIYAIFAPFEATDISSAIALISVYALGYEGADRRFVAIPIGNKFQ